jgi:erythrin-vacuolar iron transport family protein
MTGRINFAALELKDALDLAILIEEEARERYHELATLVGVGYEGDAADFFRFMAENERKHGEALQEYRKARFRDEPSAVNRGMIFDVEAPDYSGVRAFMSPRQAMRIAMESEEKAFEFFDEALTGVVDPEIRDLFTSLRAEEKGHRELLENRMDDYPGGPEIDESSADEPSAL